MAHRVSREQGQSLVLLALGLMGLLAFAALAVDGGMLYLDRREAQNAADAAALAGALAKGEGQPWRHAALNRAASNGFDNDGDSNTVQVYSPPISGAYAGNSEAVQVVITSTLNSPFARFIFDAPLQNTVEAVARIRPRRGIAPGYAIYGGNPNACSTVWFAGTQDTHVVGGGVYSNSRADVDDCPSGKQNGSGEVYVDGGEIHVAGLFYKAGSSGSVSPAPIQFVPQQDLADVPIPDCSGLPNWGSKVVTKPTILQPGVYSRISVNGSAGLVQMMPGMYCITGSQGFSIQAGAKVVGIGVFIYMVSGPFDVQGSAEVHLIASPLLQDASGNDWSYMLIYYDPNNTRAMGIRGNSNSEYAGTIHGRAASCELAGSGGTLVIASQVVCDTVKLSGNAELDISYDEALNYYLPPTVELTQ